MENYNIRINNSNKIRKLFITKTEDKASEIAKETNLSVMTVNRILKSMLNRGEVYKSFIHLKIGGRPHNLYSYNYNYIMGLVIYAYKKNDIISFNSVLLDSFGRKVTKSIKKLDSISIIDIDKELSFYLKKYPSVKIVSLSLPNLRVSKDKLRSFILDFPLKDKVKIEKKYKIELNFVSTVNAAAYGIYNKDDSPTNEAYMAIFSEKNDLKRSGLVINKQIYLTHNNKSGLVNYLEKKEYSSGNILLEQLADIIIPSCALFNPKKIIIYGRALNEELIKLLRFRIGRTFKHSINTSIDYEKSISIDFLIGIVNFTYDQLKGYYNRKIIKNYENY